MTAAAAASQKPVPVITPKEPASAATSSTLTTITTPSSSRQTVTGEKEKIGRWSEEEHKVFLQGLAKHGKQWKIIAGMIGTRTVVQVRTHAQKYFQRMERAQNGGSSSAAINKASSSPKRKMSLPASLPSRGKKAKTSPAKKTLPRAASLSLVSNTASPTPELSTYPSYVSNSSSEGSWGVTISPNGIAQDIIEQLNAYDGYYQQPAETTTFQQEADDAQQAASNSDDEDADAFYDFKGLGQDPLEWLVEAEPSILPESSLPIFPDLSTTGENNNDDTSQQQHQVSASSSLQPQQQQPEIVENSTSSSEDDDEDAIVDAALNTMADPTLTVQSLFMLPTEQV
jgi:SHAQKYF class myb-like DNA-binding protein